MTTLLKQAAPADAAKQVAASTAVVRTPAADLLAAARAEHAAGRYLACIERCDRLMVAFAASPEAGEARRLSAGITADPVKWRQVTGQLETDLTALQQNLGVALGR